MWPSERILYGGCLAQIPGEFSWRQQYGGGTAYENTICIDGERVLMLGDDGLLQYDGLAVAPYYQEFAYNIFKRMNKAALEEACACMWRGKYFISLPMDTSTTNNAVLIYDTQSASWTYRTDLRVEAFMPSDKALYFTSVDEPGKVYEWEEILWKTGAAASPVKWVGPWLDFNAKDMAKGGWSIYFIMESLDEASISFSIETEKKKKTKVFEVAPAADHPRQKRLSFGGSGRRFRLCIESASEAPWRIIGGIHIKTEIDRD